MIHTLENSTLWVKVSEKGAELNSIFCKNKGIEYLWQADLAFWPRQAPILFPIVGRLKDHSYIHEGKPYMLLQHGFARDKFFKLVKSGQNVLAFELHEDEESLQHFPFPFRLHISYRLLKDTLQTIYYVENTGIERMYFSIGGHPGFRCPLLPDEHYEDYYLEFDKPENARRWLLKNGLFTGECVAFLKDEKMIALSPQLFKDDAIVLKHLDSSEVALRSRKGHHGMTLNFKGFPYLGIWAKPGAEFVCIEPWYGLADHVAGNPQFSQREGTLSLPPGGKFECVYSITPF